MQHDSLLSVLPYAGNDTTMYDAYQLHSFLSSSHHHLHAFPVCKGPAINSSKLSSVCSIAEDRMSRKGKNFPRQRDFPLPRALSVLKGIFVFVLLIQNSTLHSKPTWVSSLAARYLGWFDLASSPESAARYVAIQLEGRESNQRMAKTATVRPRSRACLTWSTIKICSDTLHLWPPFF